MPLNLHRRLPRRFAATLALFAIWLTVLVPVASQLLVRAAAPDAIVCSADDHRTAQRSESQHRAAHHLDACGYCSLLAHCPALGGASRADAAVFTTSADAPASPGLGPPRTFRRLSHPPRAPPAQA